jgi:ATP phosphoribosyltransferase regulatory subunit
MFGKPGGAVGFAIYLDQLDSLSQPRREYDVDVLLVCGERDGVSVARAVQKLRLKGRSVLAVSRLPENGTSWREAVNIEDIISEDKTN